MSQGHEKVTTKYHAREISLYYLTAEEIDNLGTNSLWGTILTGCGTFFLGALFSESSNRNTFLVLGTTLLLVSFIFHYQAIKSKRSIKQRKQTISDRAQAAAPNPTVVLAEYGADGTFVDVTERIASATENGSRPIVTNDLCGIDPVPNVHKTLRVRYIFHGEQFQKEFAEGSPIQLPQQ
jgi:hypothetical protein